MPGALSPLSTATVAPDLVCAWQGETLLVVNPRGECDGDSALTGLYYREARYLSLLRFTINGHAPWLCEAGRDNASTLHFAYIYPELVAFGGGGSGRADDGVALDADNVPFRALDLLLTWEVEPARAIATLDITNRMRQTVQLELTWALDADFADLQEAAGGSRQQEGDVRRENSGNELRLTYEHPVLCYQTGITAAGSRWAVSDTGLTKTIALASQETAHLTLSIHPYDYRGRYTTDDVERRRRHLHRWTDAFTTVSAPGNPAVEMLIHRNIAAFASSPLLQGQDDEWLAAQAGLPLYPGLFGRDTLTAGWQAAFVDHGDLLEASLVRLGRMQGSKINDWRDEQPGRLPAQARDGPLARLGLNPFSAYYADFASPLMFVIALAHLYAWRGDRSAITPHWDTARRVLDWARSYGDLDGDGYLEYQTRSPQGVKNQGWKDSGDAILYEDGSPVPSPIATSELQGYWYAAQQLMAILCEAMGLHDEAGAYWEAARDLKERFNRDWWVESQQCIGLAMDPDKRLVAVPASNAGHCLATGIINDEHLPSQVGRLFAPDLFSGWGVRTLSSAHPSFNPVSYHLGSVWPVENATIAFGLRRFGFDTRAQELAEAVFDLAALYQNGVIPECVGGYARGCRPLPGAYPRANPWQLWNASAIALLVHTLLGLQPVAPLHLLVVDPALPAWLPEVRLRGLRLGGASATIRFWRDAHGASHAEVEQKRGTFHLLRQPPPESLRAGVADRFGALMESVMHH